MLLQKQKHMRDQGRSKVRSTEASEAETVDTFSLALKAEASEAASAHNGCDAYVRNAETETGIRNGNGNA